MVPSLYTEYKEERIKLFINHLKNLNADIVCLQEVVNVYGITLYPKKIIKEAKKIGFHFVAKSTQFPKLPNTICVDGHLILSKYPIKSSEFIPFNRSPFYEVTWVTRGALYAQIEYPGKSLHVFSAHTSSGGQVVA